VRVSETEERLGFRDSSYFYLCYKSQSDGGFLLVQVARRWSTTTPSLAAIFSGQFRRRSARSWDRFSRRVIWWIFL